MAQSQRVQRRQPAKDRARQGPVPAGRRLHLPRITCRGRRISGGAQCRRRSLRAGDASAAGSRRDTSGASAPCRAIADGPHRPTHIAAARRRPEDRPGAAGAAAPPGARAPTGSSACAATGADGKSESSGRDETRRGTRGARPAAAAVARIAAAAGTDGRSASTAVAARASVATAASWCDAWLSTSTTTTIEAGWWSGST